MTWTMFSTRPATQRAAKALITDPSLSDALLAEQANVSAPTIGRVRAALTQIGVIEHIPVSQRTRKPYPLQLSPTAAAIAAGATTPREVADAASVSMQAAWRALRKLNPPLADAAAATDRLRVVKHDAACEHCHRPYTPDRTRGGHAQRYCGEDCRDAAKRERQRTTGRPPPAPHPPKPPKIPSLPEPPPWHLGVCANVPARMRSWWTSRDRDEREAASRMCGGCAIKAACEQWAIALPVDDSSVYAGMSQQERLRRKRAALAEFTRQTLKVSCPAFSGQGICG